MLGSPVTPARASCVALLLVLGLRCGPASAGGFFVPEAGARLSPGSLVTASWASSRAIQSATEAELLLSLDGGLSFPIRLTRDLHSGIQSVLFRVPHLPTRHARLALRIGSGGPRDEEVIEHLGPEFAIEADRAPSLEPLVSVRGEWRTYDAIEGPVSAFPAADSLAGSPDRVSALTAPVELDHTQTAPEVFPRLPATQEPAEAILVISPLPAPHCRSQLSSPKLE